MRDDFHKQFLTHSHNYVLLDSGGDIRASSWFLEGIVLAKIHYGWGTIHRLEFEGRTIKIGEEIE